MCKYSLHNVHINICSVQRKTFNFLQNVQDGDDYNVYTQLYIMSFYIFISKLYNYIFVCLCFYAICNDLSELINMIRTDRPTQKNLLTERQ